MGARGRKRGWTDEQLIAAVKESTGWRMVSRALGLCGGNTAFLKAHAARVGADSSHFREREPRATDLQDRADGFEDVEPIGLRTREIEGAGTNLYVQSWRDQQLDRFELHDVKLPPDTPPSQIDYIPTGVPGPISLSKKWKGLPELSYLPVTFTWDRLRHPPRSC